MFKKIIATCITVGFVSLAAFAQKGPVFKFNDANDKFDFGTVKEGASITHEFEFTNVGDQPLIVMSAEATCGCTTPEWPKQPVPPKGKGKIKVTFNTEGKPGAAYKPVYIKSNATLSDPSKKRHEVALVGNVEPKGK